jgi:MFS family permease
MRLGLVAGIAAGVFGLVKGWDFVAWGGGAIAAGCVAGMALASVPPWLWAVFGVGAAACVIGPVIWHTKLKPRAVPSPALSM